MRKQPKQLEGTRHIQKTSKAMRGQPKQSEHIQNNQKLTMAIKRQTAFKETQAIRN